ncbi:MAG TPA: single-stranded-DNA-specific exonuclease RecJ [Longimicrobiales bacterium]
MSQPQSQLLQQSIPPRWVARAQPAPGVAATLASELALPPALCRLLALRGFTQSDSAKRYLKPRLEELHDPFLLAGMDAAVERVRRAISAGEKILVHGDYDVDGICSAALYARVLRSLGATVQAFVPHRLTDGYDLGHAGVRAAAEFGATLILTGDCGIVAHEAVRAAADLGIDVIVTDHHTPGAELPACAAVINPNRSDCRYPEKGLAGVGVAFKLCQALAKTYGLPQDALWYYLDLVAVATIADLAPLTGENRTLTRFGLKVLKETKNPGLAALLKTAGLSEHPVLAAGQISHVLAPRINAVGRMSEAARGVKLLLEDDPASAFAIAQSLEDENRTRQEVDRATLQQALDLLEGDYDPDRNRVIVLAAEGWHPGVIGIVASRVVELLHRPTILIALEEGGARGRGSARSIPAFHLYNGLHSCAHHLDRFGGHKYAAGLEIRAENIPLLRADLEAYAAEVLTPDDLVPELCYDLELTIPEANADLLRLMRHLGPHGVGNPSPVFVARQVTVGGYPKIVGENHLKLQLVQDGVQLPAIGFRMAHRLNDLDVTRGKIDVAFQLHLDRFNGQEYLQAKLLDLRASA